MKNSPEQLYGLWLASAKDDADLQTELSAMKGNSDLIFDAFYRDLAFGTGGLRGVIGAGTNRMNIYTVRKASLGLARYVLAAAGKGAKIAVSYDSRIKSRLFAEQASAVFASLGLKVFMYPALMPTPCLSYAVRALGCASGIMVTASHNPSKYNGYKVYGSDGCQITDAAAAAILAEIEKADCFEKLSLTFEDGLRNGSVSYIEDAVTDAFLAEVKKTSPVGPDEKDKNLKIVYSPLNGTGLVPVTRILAETGYTDVTVVPEQREPNGNFPTCPYPNPEIREAMAKAVELATAKDADLVLATDPDCDRVGIAVKDNGGKFVLITGNEVGLLLLDFLLETKKAKGTLRSDAVMVKTVVTTDLADVIAERFGVRTVNVLTGFKYIGEVIGNLEKEGDASRYLFGFEESYGYLGGSYVRDKDGVYGAFIICEMCAALRRRGISVYEQLQAVYAKYGYALNTLHSYTFEGAAGFATMQGLMKDFRENTKEIAGTPVASLIDYLNDDTGLPKSDVLKFRLTDGTSVVVRPSGTEPKLKIYLSVRADGEAAAHAKEAVFAAALTARTQK
ncbi:MAG: phospho-sugar mutase [Clostridia bacterium]|nr:phospho-sugar mutase [Clostridia bacterium]